ncbi:hypothetical protein HYW83_06130 [Candidatus Peregrinibacteria bacterium]|nr:hypothetical protein [Candidatus Peregrinibacteria bacterium]
MVLRYGELIDACDEWKDRHCNVQDDYTARILAGVSNAIWSAMNRRHHELFPDAPAGLNLPPDMEVMPEMLLAMLHEVDEMLATETIADNVADLFSGEERQLFTILLSAFDRSDEPAQRIFNVTMHVVPHVTRQSPLFSLVQAALTGDADVLLRALQDLLKARSIKPKPIQRSPGIAAFLKNFRALVMNSLGVEDAAGRVALQSPDAVLTSN